MWPYFGRLWRGLLSLLNIADIICARYCHFRESLGRRERANSASLLQGRAAFVAARAFAWENPSKPRFAGVLMRILARFGHRGPAKMRRRSLGNSGLEVAPLAFGGNVFGWTVDERTSFRLLDAFVAAGFNLIDTADAYSRFAPGNRGGESETIIGKWLKQGGRRDKVIIATKVGLEMGPQMKGLSKAYILRAVEDSLRRLQTDYIDLYQSHRDDPDTPL